MSKKKIAEQQIIKYLITDEDFRKRYSPFFTDDAVGTFDDLTCNALLKSYLELKNYPILTVEQVADNLDDPPDREEVEKIAKLPPLSKKTRPRFYDWADEVVKRAQIEKYIIDSVGHIDKKNINKVLKNLKPGTIQLPGGDVNETLKNGKEILTIELPQVKAYLSNGLLEESMIMFIVGKSKIGKTLLTLNLALCLASGTRFLAFDVPRKCNILFIETEGNINMLQKRLQKLNKARAEWKEGFENITFVNLQRAKTLKLTNPLDTIYLNDVIKAKGIDIIIFDPFQRFHNLSSMDEKDMNLVFDQVFGLIAEHPHLAVIFIDHKPHHRQDKGSQAPVGSHTKGDLGDSYTNMEAIGEGYTDSFKIDFGTRNEGIAPLTLRRDDDLLYHILGKDVLFFREQDVIDCCLNYFNSKKPKDDPYEDIGRWPTKTDLAKYIKKNLKLKVTDDEINAQIDIMVSTGKLTILGWRPSAKLDKKGRDYSLYIPAEMVTEEINLINSKRSKSSKLNNFI